MIHIALTMRFYNCTRSSIKLPFA